jgi:acylphosphatase
MSQASLHAIVSGRVQGVYFRAFVESHATCLGLTGYVRNLPDVRKVEVIAEGDKTQLEKLLDYLKQGPPRSGVEEVSAFWSNESGRYPEFKIEY